MPNITNIPAPRVSLIDDRTGLMSREWYRFFLNLFTITGSGTTNISVTDLEVQLQQPDLSGAIAVAAQNTELAIPVVDVTGEVDALRSEVALAPVATRYDDAIRALQSTVETTPAPSQDSAIQSIQASLDATLSAPALGTMAAQNYDNLPYLGFNPAPTPAAPVGTPGVLYWNGGYTLNLGMTATVTQPIGEAQYFYIKASSSISIGQLVMFSGVVGASGLITGAPSTGVTDGQYLIGVAAENIALNGFGLVQKFGLVRGFDTSGTPYGEVWADGDILYYNPTTAGGLTKTIPNAPNVRATIAVVIHAGTGGSGSAFVRVSTGSELGITDSNVQWTSLTDQDLIQYDGTAGYWKNVTGKAPGFSAYPSASQTAANTTFVKLAFNTTEFNVNSNYDAATNYRFTPSVSGYYAVNLEVCLGGYSVASGGTFIAIYKNGSAFRYVDVKPNTTTSQTLSGSDLMYLNGTTDYIEAYLYQNSGASQTVAINTNQYNKFQAILVKHA